MSLKTVKELVNIAERQGFAFQISVEASIPNATPLITFFQTGDKPVIIYSRRLSYTGDGVNALLFRDAIFSGGVPIEAFSVNDLVQNDAEAVFYSGATTAADGIETRAPVYVFGNTSNQGQGASLQAIEEPQILPPNSVYRFVLESRAGTQTVASQIEWCELEHVEGLSFASGEWEYVGEELKV